MPNCSGSRQRLVIARHLVLVVFIIHRTTKAIIKLKYYLTAFRNDEIRCCTNKGIALLLFEVKTNKPI